MAVRLGAWMPVRDYVYISDTKVDMLFAQIPRPLAQRISGELKVDLKLIGVSLRDVRTAETRYAKLALVESYIRDQLNVGTVDEPGRYVHGTLPMRWGPYGEHQDVVFFAGASDQTVVGLGGSFAHVLGAARSGRGVIGSAAPLLYRTLAGEVEAGDESQEPCTGRGRQAAGRAWTKIVVDAAQQLAPPTQRLEFLARCDGVAEHQAGSRRRVLLGSPLFVANAPD